MKRFGKAILFVFLALVMSLFWTVGCSKRGPVELDRVDNDTLAAVSQSSISASLNGDQLTVTWGGVPSATSYLVTVDGVTFLVYAPTTTTVFPDIEYVSGSITITIVARADGYNSSVTTCDVTPTGAPPQTQTLATPTGLYVSNGKLTWTAVVNAVNYIVSDGKTNVTTNSNTIDLAVNGLTVPTDGSVTYTVVAKAPGYNDSTAASFTYSPNDPVDPTPSQTLSMPTGLYVSNGRLSWSSVMNATSYTVSDGTNSVTVNVAIVDLAASGLDVPTNGTVVYTVVAKAAGYSDSAAAVYPYTVIPSQPTLDTPRGLNVNNGTLSWTAVSNATSYIVSDGATIVTVTSTSVDLAAKGFIVPASGKATYTVVAKGAGYNDSAAAAYTHTYSDSETTEGYVTFGEYPQSLKSDSVTVNTIADSDGYFVGSDGARYAKVTADPYVQYPGYAVNFSNGDKVTAGTVYYFKVEPIKWRVLGTSGGNTLLFCDSIIDNGVYYSGQETRVVDGSTVYPNNYKYSDIRAWLNGNFYTSAFSSSEQAIIKTTTVDNSAATTGSSVNIYACEDTDDKVFILGEKEISNITYGFSIDKTDYDDARKLVVSDYARAVGAYVSDSILYNGCGIWWLRSPMFDGELTVNCGSASGMIASSKVYSSENGIAPAIWVDSSAL